jgi:excisionase family DNA binding protein
MRPKADEVWLTIKQAAAMLGIHSTTLRRWADEGQLPVLLTPGGHRRFSKNDIERFTEERRRLRVVAGMEALWAEQALSKARQKIVHQEKKQWLAVFDDEERAHKRMLGRRMIDILLRYVSSPESGERILEEARSIGYEHAESALELGLPSTDALRVAMFFRDAVVEAAFDLPDKAQVQPEANVELLRSINTILNVVQLAITQRYDQEVVR